MVAFEERAATLAERNEQSLTTPPMMASGRLKGVLIQDREDRKRVSRTVIDEAAQRSKSAFSAAVEWAAQVGFTPAQQHLAASAALLLRGSLGSGRVTKRAVLERCRAQYPWLFESSERAA